MIRIVKIAEKEIDYCESPANSNNTKYGEWFGLNGVAWCAIFVSWIYDQAGFNLGNIGYTKGFAGCQTAVKHFKETNEITKDPQPGDISIYDWKGNGKYKHTGIFLEKIDSYHFYAIEGNTSVSNNSNGGQVMKRKRKYATAIFVHPKILDK